MGMFDTDLGKPWTENFSEGEAFRLDAARLGPVLQTERGPSRVVLLEIGGETYSIFGQGIVNAVENQEEGDLPADVKIIRKATKTAGNEVKLLVPADSTGDDIPF